MGSVSMSGGVGSAAAFGPTFEQVGAANGTLVGLAAATAGLVMGSLVGGPVAKRLIDRYSLETAGSEAIVDLNDGTGLAVIKESNVAASTSIILITMAMGTYLVLLLNNTGITFPYYVGGVFAAAIVRNVCDARGYKLRMPEIDVIGNVALNLFLALTLMSLKIWELFNLATPMIVVLLCQAALMAIFAYFVVFPLAFGFLTHTAPEGVLVSTDIASYLNFVMGLFMAFGVAFEVPVAIVLLCWMGVTTPQSLRQKRPYVLVGAFVVGMLLTPPDVFSQTLLAIPMYCLFEVGVFFARFYTGKRRQGDEGEEETTTEE